jgi:hypothetical protein
VANIPVNAPWASANINGDDRPLGQVTMSLACGGVSRCLVTSYENNDAAGESGVAIDALAEDVATELADQQGSMFEMTSTANSAVTVNDGTHTLVFRGFPSNPSYNNSLGGTGLSHVLIHEAAILSAYRSFIYLQPELVYKQTDLFVGADGKGLTSTEMTTRFMEVLDIIVNTWEKSSSRSSSSDTTGQGEPTFSLIQREARHIQNQAIYPRLKQIMDGSLHGATWLELKSSDVSSGLQQNAQVSKHIAELLGEKVGDFFNTLGNFGQSFHSMFVPEFPAGPDRLGHFVSYDTIGNANILSGLSTLYLPITNLQFSGGNRGYLPLTHVLVNGEFTSQYRDNSGTGQGNLQLPLVTVYPTNPNLAGLGANFPGPPWLTPVLYEDVDRSKIFIPQHRLDLKRYAAAVKRVQDAAGTLVKGYKKDILDRWAQNLYTFTALSSTSCSLQIPLDVSITPGARYSVHNMKQDLIFTGFLAQVNHRLQVQPRQGVASTDLTFSHVCAGDFTLPS